MRYRNNKLIEDPMEPANQEQQQIINTCLEIASELFEADSEVFKEWESEFNSRCSKLERWSLTAFIQKELRQLEWSKKESA
jgi:hypothetical protein